MSKKKKKKVLRKDRAIILLCLVLGVFCLGGYGVYRIFRLFIPAQNVNQEIVPPKEDVTSDSVSADHSSQIKTIQAAHATEQVNVTGFTDDELRSLFYDTEIDDTLMNRISGTTWTDDQDFIKPSDLRYVRVLYKDFNNNTAVGELIVNQKLAVEVEDIFYDLYKHDYQIDKMILPDAYGGDDNQSMLNDNTSAFSFRFSDGVGVWAHEHAQGLAIDLNPFYNPFVIHEGKDAGVYPAAAAEYGDRSNVRDHMITKDDYAYQVFTNHGFTWGGDWGERTDYQHFEKYYTAPTELPYEVSSQTAVDETEFSDQAAPEAAPEADPTLTEDQVFSEAVTDELYTPDESDPGDGEQEAE